MTILFGILSSNNEADCRLDLDSMLQSLSDCPSDTTATWHSPGISLGQKTIHITPESSAENFPHYSAINNITIIGDIRLDNRPELFTALSIPLTQKDTYSDAHLVMAAYQKWGESCPGHLLGDFSFVLWDEKKKKLICCVDHFGLRGLFYFYDGKKFIFASSPNPIQAVKDVPSAINYNKLSTLIFPMAKHLFWEESWFDSIYPIPAATLLTIDKNGVHKHKYWTPELKDELRFKNEDEYAEAFQELMFRAISDRLRSQFPVSASLSGGLDSSSIVSVAAKILEKQNRELEVFSAVLSAGADPVLTDEREYIDLFHSYPNVKINYITAPGRGFFSGLEALKTTIIGPNLTSRHYLYTAFAEKAEELGSRVMLEGLGGELGISFHGDGCYAELFRRMRWRSLWQELYSRKKLLGESIGSNLKSQVIRPLLPSVLLNTLQRPVAGLNKTHPHCIRQDIVDTLRKQLEPREKELNSWTATISSSHRHNQLNGIRAKQNKGNAAADLGLIEQRYPLMDKRLLEFCLAAPVEFKVKNGYKRYLLRSGLKDILPAKIQWRNSKSPFSPDYIRRYKQQLSEARVFLDDISPNDPVRSIIDVEKLKTFIDIPVADDEYGTFAEKAARDFVPQGIYLICFLRRFSEFQN